MAMRGPRLAVGSKPWIAEEKASAVKLVRSEVEEFSYSAQNDFEWLNEHMAGIFDENEVNMADVFKTPGKLRGRTPRTARKAPASEARVPLSNIFSVNLNGVGNSFARQPGQLQSPIAKINNNSFPVKHDPQPQPSHATSFKPSSPGRVAIPTDSGYFGSQQDFARSDSTPIPPSTPDKTNPADNEEDTRSDAPDSRPRTLGEISSEAAREEYTAHVVPEIMRRSIGSISEQQTVVPPPYLAEATTADKPPKSPVTISSPLKKSPQKSHSKPEDVLSPPIRNEKSRPRSPGKPGPEEDQQSEQLDNPAGDMEDSETDGSLMEVPNVDENRPLEEVEKRDQTMKDGDHEDGDHEADDQEDNAVDSQSTSDSSSSPIRPVVRKSSLNFASLPAREPLASNKSMGARLSRTSQLDHHRTSYYDRPTGGKSLGNNAMVDLQQSRDELDTGDVLISESSGDVNDDIAADHSKTYTQRLQDRISMLGQAQPNATRSSKSIARLSAGHIQAASQVLEVEVNPTSPTKKPDILNTPGAFPMDDEEDDWLAPPMTMHSGAPIVSPRPVLEKSYTADIMEGLHDKLTVGGTEFPVPGVRSRSGSPSRPAIPDRATSNTSHHKTSSVPIFPELSPHKTPQKIMSCSDYGLAIVSERDALESPSKSVSRHMPDSPLKQVKNKLSSIFKGSRGLLASSAAISAEGKSSLLSPSRIDLRGKPSTESLATSAVVAELTYPDLGAHVAAEPQSPTMNKSPVRANVRRTRASVEKEKEKKLKEKEAKKFAEQMGKLERVREKEAERARIFNKDKEIATTEKRMPLQVLSSSSPRREAPKQTKTSAQEAKSQEATLAFDRPAETTDNLRLSKSDSSDVDDDVVMADAPTVTTQSQTKTALSATPGQTPRVKEAKRPVKPSKETAGKSKQAPTVIRVNTGSQNSQYHPSNNALAANLHETLGPAATPAPSQASKTASKPPPSLKTKASNQSLKSSVSSVGRPKALDIAARRKEQEEREAQRKRDAKVEIERKRAALQDEERRLEQERQKQQREREEAEAKKNMARRLAALEKAKQTRAPPPATRPNPNGAPDYGSSQRSEVARPASRMQSTIHRSQEEHGRPVNTVLSVTAMSVHKRTLSQQENEDYYGRNGQSRNGATYQGKDAKRRRTSEGNDEEVDMQMPKIKGPPVRPSGGLKKDLHTKSMFPNGYTPGPQASSRDLFKTAVSGQAAAKASHPLDMAQVSKAAIPFANPNAHKTPARPVPVTGAKSVAKSAAKSVAKSAVRSSPHLPQGDSIELPEIQTDDEDSDEDDSRGAGAIAPWADSPDLRRALMQQEILDPSAIFGLPGPLVMEEVFKDKSRWSKFRSRTSSANWSGTDRLTEEEVRKDIQAMDKLRKEGGWSYQVSKDLL